MCGRIWITIMLLGLIAVNGNAATVDPGNITPTAGNVLHGLSPQLTVDGSGLNGSGEHGTVFTTMWLGNNGPVGTHPGTVGVHDNWIAFEFDQAYELSAPQIWNFNASGTGSPESGLNNVTISYSADLINWVTLGDYQFPKAPGTPDYTGFVGPSFGGALVRGVVITAHVFTGDTATSGNWLPPFSDVGLSEIQFNIVPEPITMTFLGLGSLIAIRRRKKV